MLKKLLAFFEVVLVVALIILIIAIFTFHISFSKENSLPSIFGNSFFILNTADMQNENGTGINKGALVIASDNELDSLKEGMVVLCDINDIETAEPVYNVLRIYAIEPNSESTMYTVSNEQKASNRTYIIGKDKILAKCTYSSDTLGQIIAFSRTTNGIVILIILPCVILIALQIVHLVARARRNKFEKFELEAFEFPSDMTFPDDEQSPLYNVADHDFSQKTDVEGNFANKNEKQDKKSKNKSAKKSLDAKSDIKSEVKKSETDKNTSAKDDSEKKNKKDNRKKVAVKTEESDTAVKEESKSDEVKTVDKKSDIKAVPVKSENEAETIKKDEKPLDIKSVTDTKVSQAENIKEQSAQEVEDVKAEDKSVEEIKPESDEVSAESATENIDAAVGEKSENVVENNSEQTKSEVDTVITESVAAVSEAPRLKKKTTVKKRAVVKRTPSTSASDLLKAIDTESKKLQ